MESVLSERVVYVLYDSKLRLFAVGVGGKTGFVTRHINRCREFARNTDAIDYDIMEGVVEWRDDDDAVTMPPNFTVRQVSIKHEML